MPPDSVKPFTEDELLDLKNLIKDPSATGFFTEDMARRLIARMEAAEQCAYGLEAVCEVECTGCGCELGDPHEKECDIELDLKNWYIRKGGK